MRSCSATSATEPARRGRAARRAWPLLAAALLAACAASSGPAPLLLTLPGLDGPSRTAEAVAGPPGVLAVRRVTLPEYMVARRVRYRADPSTLAEWPNTFWGERVEIGAARTFYAALQAQLAGWTLCDIHCDDPAAPALQIDVVSLDYLRSARHLQAQARLSLHGTPSAPAARARDVAYDVPSGGDSPQAQAQAMTELMRRIAADAARLARGQAP